MPITGILLFMLLFGCAKTRIGKVELSDEKLPNFLKVGTTRAQEVLEQIGEPFGNREQENSSARIFIDFQEDYVNLLITDIRRKRQIGWIWFFKIIICKKQKSKKKDGDLVKIWILNIYNCWSYKTLFFHFSSIK